MELLENLPEELHWHVIKYLKHPVAQIFQDAIDEAHKQLIATIVEQYLSIHVEIVNDATNKVFDNMINELVLSRAASTYL